MCSEIDKRTRDNPEAAMVHAKPIAPQLMNGDPSKFGSGQMGNPWPCPKGEAQCQDKGDQERFNRAAHEAFLRSLG